MQFVSNRLDPSCCECLSTWVEFEQSDSSNSAGRGFDLRKFGKEYGEQGLNFVLVACHFITRDCVCRRANSR